MYLPELFREPRAVAVTLASSARRTMEARGAPSEARAILHVAHSFADELSTLDPRFDRLQFIKDITEDPA